jgi:hypothetical protein
MKGARQQCQARKIQTLSVAQDLSVTFSLNATSKAACFSGEASV